MIQNIKVVDNNSEYKVSTIKFLVYFVKNTSVKEVNRSEIPDNIHVINEFANIISSIASRDTLVGMSFILFVNKIVCIFNITKNCVSLYFLNRC